MIWCKFGANLKGAIVKGNNHQPKGLIMVLVQIIEFICTKFAPQT